LCHTIFQVSFRSKSRLLTALLLILAAFGATGASLFLVRATQTAVCQSAKPSERSHAVAEQSAAMPVPSRPSPNVAPPESRRPQIVAHFARFQRPPPVALRTSA